MAKSTDRVICTVTTQDMHGNKSASITMDLDSPPNSYQESQLLVYESENDFRDARNPGRCVGSISVTTNNNIEDRPCSEEHNLVCIYICHNGYTTITGKHCVPKNLHVAQLKEICKDWFDVAVQDQRLVHKGQTLTDDRTIASYDFRDGDIVDLTSTNFAFYHHNLTTFGHRFSYGPQHHHSF